jgi:hypothetical protein
MSLANYIPAQLRPSWDYVGGLSVTSKMPGPSYGIPASACITGAKLAKVAGSTCSGCYAVRGNYGFKNVQSAQHRRMESITNPAWVRHMVRLINHYAGPAGVFRWHDSGDLQSVGHLAKICAVAALTPTIRHWLPTREYAFVRAFRKLGGVVPSNLIIRASAHMVDGPAPADFAHTSGVHTKGNAPSGAACPAYEQGGVCGDCRNCWDKDVPHVSYKKH